MRSGTAADAIEGVIPTAVEQPDSAEAVAGILARASKEHLSVFTKGGGTKLAWGPAPQPIDVLISTERLGEVVAHRHGDLTATIQAGATLGEVNRILAKHGQWIPLDPPGSANATIGGVVATNDSGPRRHRYGAPRDLIIGVEFARADGRLAKGGGIVVKNVAGYDIPRLMTGSFGSLAVIVTATFKLYPLTRFSRTLVVSLNDPRDLGTLTGQILSSHLTPTAVEFQTPPLRLLLRFESIEEAVEQQASTASALIEQAGFRVTALSGPDEDQLWAEHGGPGSNDGTAVVKVSTLPTELAGVLAKIDQLAGGTGYAAAGRAGVGVFVLRLDGPADLQKRIITGVRDSLPAGRGSAVVMRAPAELKAQLDVWGPIGDGLPLMRLLKQEFDPAGILNRGRGPGGV